MRVCKHYTVNDKGEYRSLVKQKGKVYMCTTCSTVFGQDAYNALMRYCGLQNQAANLASFGSRDMITAMLYDLECQIPGPRPYEARETDEVDPAVNPFFYNKGKK